MLDDWIMAMISSCSDQSAFASKRYVVWSFRDLLRAVYNHGVFEDHGQTSEGSCRVCLGGRIGLSIVMSSWEHSATIQQAGVDWHPRRVRSWWRRWIQSPKKDYQSHRGFGEGLPWTWPASNCQHSWWCKLRFREWHDRREAIARWNEVDCHRAERVHNQRKSTTSDAGHMELDLAWDMRLSNTLIARAQWSIERKGNHGASRMGFACVLRSNRTSTRNTG